MRGCGIQSSGCALDASSTQPGSGGGLDRPVAVVGAADHVAVDELAVDQTLEDLPASVFAVDALADVGQECRRRVHLVAREGLAGDRRIHQHRIEADLETAFVDAAVNRQDQQVPTGIGRHEGVVADVHAGELDLPGEFVVAEAADHDVAGVAHVVADQTRTLIDGGRSASLNAVAACQQQEHCQQRNNEFPHAHSFP